VVRVRYQYHMVRNISGKSEISISHDKKHEKHYMVRVRYQYHMMRNISGKSEISISHDEKH
jgi:hypothetical protein